MRSIISLTFSGLRTFVYRAFINIYQSDCYVGAKLGTSLKVIGQGHWSVEKLFVQDRMKWTDLAKSQRDVCNRT
jgi:hypothetical protein